MELAKDIFFFIGSGLGILAFLKALFEPAFSDNRQKWDKVKERLTEQDLIDLQHQIHQSLRIRDELLSKVFHFVHDIEEDADYLHFGPPFRRQFQKHKAGLRKEQQHLIDYVQVPYWEYQFVDDEDNEEDRSYWKVNKTYFYRELSATASERDQAYQDNLNGASDAIDQIRIHYRAMGILANLHVFQAPFARQIAKKRSKLP